MSIERMGQPYIFHEADPAYIVLEACAMRYWRDLIDYQNQVKNQFVAFAQGEYLDHLGANPDFKCPRLLIAAGNPNANPPTEDVWEGDEEYRKRLTLTNEGYTSAGSVGAYLFHALSASGDVRDAAITSPEAGVVQINILSYSNNGQASQSLIDTVQAATSAEKVRPLCDLVQVKPANIINYGVIASITTYPAANAKDVIWAADSSIQTYCNNHYRIGHDITRSGLIAAITVAGVQNVTLISPASDLISDNNTARQCVGINITQNGEAL